jgi:pyruvate dehydrogenase phosphatase
MFTNQFLPKLLTPLLHCDTHIEGVGSFQYVANKQIEDRVGQSQVKTTEAKLVEFITVMDGHGGHQLADHLTKELPSIFQSELASGKSVTDALKAAFIFADNQWLEKVLPVYHLGFTNPIKVGACAVAVAIDQTNIVVASVGDCKCIIARSNGDVVDLNIERNINHESEQQRLRSLHPDEEDIVKCKRQWQQEVAVSMFKKELKTFYAGCYVKGRLQPTKSFGDFHLKDERVHFDHERKRPFLDPSIKKSFPYIDVEPDITVTRRTKEDKFLVVATDGLWDQFSSAEAAMIVEGALKVGLSPVQASEELVEAALKRAALNHKIPLNELKLIPPGSGRRSLHDDISVCVVLL